MKPKPAPTKYRRYRGTPQSKSVTLSLPPSRCRLARVAAMALPPYSKKEPQIISTGPTINNQFILLSESGGFAASRPARRSAAAIRRTR
jgi:hypothetical protein